MKFAFFGLIRVFLFFLSFCSVFLRIHIAPPDTKHNFQHRECGKHKMCVPPPGSKGIPESGVPTPPPARTSYQITITATVDPVLVLLRFDILFSMQSPDLHLVSTHVGGLWPKPSGGAGTASTRRPPSPRVGKKRPGHDFLLVGLPPRNGHPRFQFQNTPHLATQAALETSMETFGAA